MTSPRKFLVVLVAALAASGTVHGDVFTWEATPVNSNWNDALNWAGTASQFPDDASDTAIVDGVPTNGIDPTLNLNVSIGTLTILNNGDVFLGNYSMFVGGTATVDGSGSSLDINDSPSVFDLDTNFLTIGAASGTATVTVDGAGAILQVDNTLTVNSGGALDIDASEVEVGDDLDLNVGGIVRGDGTIQFTGVAGDDFLNDGSIQATGGTLRIERTAGSASEFDWDGSGTNGASLVVSSNSTMDIDLVLADSIFNGTITLNSTSTLAVASVWRLGTGGAVDPGVLNKEGAGVGTITGSEVTLLAGSEVNVNAGTLVFDANMTGADGSTLNVATGATLQLNGTANFNQDAIIDPAGVWSLNVNGSTTMYQTEFNWDGTGALTNVTTVGPGASLTINSDHIDLAASDQFDATLNINSGTVDVDNLPNNWVMNGTLNMDTAAGTARLNGDAVNVWGSIAATGGGTAVIGAPVRFENNPSVTVAAGTQLSLDGFATFASATASFIGAGAIENRGGMQTIADTTVNMFNGTFDLDGDYIPLAPVDLDRDLVLNVASVDNDGDGVDCTITISDDARLTINLTGGGSWTLDPSGVITYNGDAGVNHYLAGSDIALNGTINHSGDGRILARIDIGATGELNIVAAGLPLILGGGDNTSSPNTIAGGTINGPGYLAVDSNQELRGFGTINADFGYHGTLRADNGTLTFNGAFLGPAADPPIIGTADADGILNVTNAWNTNHTESVELQGGELRGATITNDGANGINGHGLISARVINNTRIDAEGGTLMVETAGNNNDWDGAGTGQLNANSGDLEIRDDLHFPFSGTVAIDAGRTVLVDGFELQFQPASTLTLTQGTYRSIAGDPLALSGDFGGVMTVQAGGPSRLWMLGGAEFLGSSTTTLEDDLRLQTGVTYVRVGAVFTGAGALTNLALSGGLVFEDGVDSADLDVLIRNNGGLSLGKDADFVDTAAQVSGSDFEQTASGAIYIELGGLGLDQFDRLDLTGAAVLDGTLRLRIFGGYVPALGDTFDVLTAAGGLGDTTFASVIQPVGLPVGRFFSVLYDLTTVQLLVISNLPGDYNNDGAVDAADYAVWRNSLGQAVTLPNDTTPGMVTQADYDEWRAHFGQTAGSGAAVSANAAVPEPATLLLVLAAVVGSFRLANRR